MSNFVAGIFGLGTVDNDVVEKFSEYDWETINYVDEKYISDELLTNMIDKYLNDRLFMSRLNNNFIKGDIAKKILNYLK